MPGRPISIHHTVDGIASEVPDSRFTQLVVFAENKKTQLFDRPNYWNIALHI